jgi:hypothetical protein
MLTVAAFLLGTQATVSPSAAAFMDSENGSMPASHCEDCGKDMVQGSQCIAICIFTVLPSHAPAFIIDAVGARLQPTVTAMPAGWSIPPETAPPRA